MQQKPSELPDRCGEAAVSILPPRRSITSLLDEKGYLAEFGKFLNVSYLQCSNVLSMLQVSWFRWLGLSSFKAQLRSSKIWQGMPWIAEQWQQHGSRSSVQWIFLHGTGWVWLQRMWCHCRSLAGDNFGQWKNGKHSWDFLEIAFEKKTSKQNGAISFKHLQRFRFQLGRLGTMFWKISCNSNHFESATGLWHVATPFQCWLRFRSF